MGSTFPSLPRAGQDQEDVQDGSAGEGCSRQLKANSLQGENAFFREAGRDIVADHDRANPRRQGCNSHPGTPEWVIEVCFID
jgi:hypothetical protein